MTERFIRKPEIKNMLGISSDATVDAWEREIPGVPETAAGRGRRRLARIRGRRIFALASCWSWASPGGRDLQTCAERTVARKRKAAPGKLAEARNAA